MYTLSIILILIFIYFFLKLLKGAGWNIKKFLKTDLHEHKDQGEALIFVWGVLVIIGLVSCYGAYLSLKHAP